MALFEDLKNILGGRSDDEVNGVINDIRSTAPEASDDQILSAVTKLAPAAKNGTMDKVIANDYVSSKYGLQQRQDLQKQIDAENQGPNYGAALTAFGTGLKGGNAAAAGQDFLNSQRQGQQRKLADFDKSADLERADVLAREENDPNSNASQLARKLALDMGVAPEAADKLTAARFKALSPVLEKKYSIEQAKLARNDASAARADSMALAREDRLARNDERKAEREDKLAQQKTEKEYALTTPFGLANSVDDAKKLKDASEAKANFDNKIDQMIALREKHGGGNVTNREDVARGKQLAKDLLLEYKNMAKLGVLSQSDENIINAIIPENPLEFNSPLAFVQGQDPTLSRLKSFKADSDKDFANRVATRVRDGNTSRLADNPTIPATAPRTGDVEEGYRFKGGDPKDPANWEEVANTKLAGGK